MAEENGIYWYLDQFALLHVFHQMKLAQNPKCKNISDCVLQHKITLDAEKIYLVKELQNKNINSVAIEINYAKLNKYLKAEKDF